jgi:hypothetical protein
LSVQKYHRLIELGVLKEHDRVELLEGLVVIKPPATPRYSNTIASLYPVLTSVVPDPWRIRTCNPITLSDSEPEPDIVLARGDDRTFRDRHPGPADVGFVAELGDTRVDVERIDMARIYARANLPSYWIINLIDRQIEVYTDPRPADPVPSYATRTDYKAGDSVPLLLDGQTVAQIPVNDLLS